MTKKFRQNVVFIRPNPTQEDNMKLEKLSENTANENLTQLSTNYHDVCAVNKPKFRVSSPLVTQQKKTIVCVWNCFNGVEKRPS